MSIRTDEPAFRLQVPELLKSRAGYDIAKHNADTSHDLDGDGGYGDDDEDDEDDIDPTPVGLTITTVNTVTVLSNNPISLTPDPNITDQSFSTTVSPQNGVQVGVVANSGGDVTAHSQDGTSFSVTGGTIGIIGGGPSESISLGSNQSAEVVAGPFGISISINN